MRDLHVRLLGSFGVTVDGAAVPADAWPQRRAADLVKLLALAPGHRLPRDRVLEALWPHLAPQPAAAALHKAAHYARRTLGARQALVVANGVVALAPEARVTTDVERLEAGELDAAAELLPEDAYEEWTAEPRERLRALVVGRLRAAGAWSEVLRLDPADEEAHRALMRERALAGDRAGAVRHFRRLSEALTPLGARPSAETDRLFRDIARGPAVVAPCHHAEPLLGRAREVAIVRDRIAAAAGGRGCVIVLTGPAGAGKTHLAETALADARERRWHTLRASAGAPGAGPLAALRAAASALLRDRPDLRAHVSDATAAALDELAARAPAEAAGALGELLAAAAGERGCALLLDDLHEADERTTDALGLLAGVAVAHRLVVLAAWRDEDARPRLRATGDELVARHGAAAIAVRPPDTAGAPATRYAVAADGAHIAFQVVGDGDGVPLVVVPGWVSNVEQTWEMPVARRLFLRLAARRPVVVWDKRGTGLSDPVAEVATMEERILDLTAVLDAAGCERAVIFGVSEGGPVGIRFAVEHPDRVAGLVLYNTAPRLFRADDWPFGWSPEIVTRLVDRLQREWGTGSLLSIWAPSQAADPFSRELFGRFQRAGASPAMGQAVVHATRAIDVRDLLGRVRAPALVVHRTGDRLVPVEAGRHLAAHIPGAVLVELPGDDHFPYLGDMDGVAEEVETFLAGLAAASPASV